MFTMFFDLEREFFLFKISLNTSLPVEEFKYSLFNNTNGYKQTANFLFYGVSVKGLSWRDNVKQGLLRLVTITQAALSDGHLG